MTFFSLLISLLLSASSIAGPPQHASTSHLHSEPVQAPAGVSPTGGGSGRSVPFDCYDNGGMPLC
ncbi:MAG TPA: hypothetical protein VGZ02_11575 [Candidatus Baltobacteraceae bacterium]|jgi:hypothetical protein|nr:hypothetical protein [Candidatus Baltobacteraceae bacterium]